MRQIGTIPNEQQAQRFQDYLLTQGITATTEIDDAAWAVWIYDEDDVENAKRELAGFLENPDAMRYAAAEQQANEIRKQQEAKAKQTQKNTIDVRRRWQRPSAAHCPVTFGMIFLSVVVAVASKAGEEHEPWINALSIASYEKQNGIMRWNGLADVESGEVWRLVTPIFIHFGIFHILFNMMWLRELGTAIEFRRGSLRFVLLVLAIAVSSNLGQYAVNRMMESGGPNFGGMSGVVYGLFGYIWMKSRFDPVSGFFMPSNLVFLMIGWFFLCMTGMIGPVANTAHGVGLAGGMLFGYLPTLWERLIRE